jgi:hypothetical protein
MHPVADIQIVGFAILELDGIVDVGGRVGGAGGEGEQDRG